MNISTGINVDSVIFKMWIIVLPSQDVLAVFSCKCLLQNLKKWIEMHYGCYALYPFYAFYALYSFHKKNNTHVR